jgi:hypothetical protein
MLSTIPYFLTDTKFIQSRSVADEVWDGVAKRPDISWRLHTFIWSAMHSISKTGENLFVECGTGKGYMVTGFLSYLNSLGLSSSITFILVDTFESSLPPEIEAQSPINVQDNYWSYANGMTEITEHFKKFKNVVLVPGLIPAVFRTFDYTNIKFLHIDLNNHLSEIETLKFFLPRMAKNSFILLDDFGFHDKKLQGASISEFARKNNIMILSLGTGQGLIYVS